MTIEVEHDLNHPMLFFLDRDTSMPSILVNKIILNKGGFILTLPRFWKKSTPSIIVFLSFPLLDEMKYVPFT